ncbi:MAG: hypothetical protein WC243_03060 [Patescibacteria group bacterium]|jgi:hypothetical protein
MPESYRPSPMENIKTPELLLGEVNSLRDQVDLLKDLVAISGTLTASIFKSIFKLN